MNNAQEGFLALVHLLSKNKISIQDIKMALENVRNMPEIDLQGFYKECDKLKEIIKGN